MANENEISIREFAKRIHVSEGAVRKAIKDGKIVEGYNKQKGKILFIQAYAEYGKNKTAPKAGHGVSKQKVAEKFALIGAGPAMPEEDDEPRADLELYENLSYTELLEKVTVHPDLPYAEAIRRNEILSVAKEKMSLEEKQGKLVEKAAIDKQLFALAVELKSQLQNIPNRITPLMRSAANEVDAGHMLLKEINQVLELFTNNI